MKRRNGDWIGVDLDGTLARWDGWHNQFCIGEPVPAMLARVKQWLADGEDVRIFTARVNPGHHASHAEASDMFRLIQDWCLKHVGVVLPITCSKEGNMQELWDDRVVQVIPNTGIRADDPTSSREPACR